MPTKRDIRGFLNNIRSCLAEDIHFRPLLEMSYYGWDEPLVDEIPKASKPQPRNSSLLWGENKHRAGLVW
ncbi:hypothetical protein LINPERPRIM_LOCUS1873, partial [Linum perenne]